MNQISGQQYADFGTANVQGSALFMNAVGQQMAAAAAAPGAASARRWPRPATARPARPHLETVGPWVSGLGGFGQRAGQRQQPRRCTYNFVGTAAGVDYRFDTETCCWVSLRATPTASNGSTASSARAGPTRSTSRPTAASPRTASMPMRWRATPTPTTSCSGRSSSPACSRRPPTADRRQPVPGPGRDRLQDRRLCTGGDDGDAVRPPAACDGEPGGVQRMGRQLAQPQRGAADDQLRAHDLRRRPRHVVGSATSARSTWACAWAGCTSMPTRPADDGGVRRRAGQRLHRLRRHAAARSAVIGFAPAATSPTPRSSTSATTASSAAAPTTMSSTSGCA